MITALKTKLFRIANVNIICEKCKRTTEKIETPPSETYNLKRYVNHPPTSSHST